jgi:predicted transposase/invertase (TIGR01784 family)
MSEITIHNPHDFLVKKAFVHKEVMQDFLQSRLPKETLQRIDMTSLRLTNKSFSTKKGKAKHSDLIYAATIEQQEGYLYVSLEHQSKEEKYMPLRQLEYNVLLMRQHLEEGHKTLPLVVNVCLYNGSQPYQGPTTLIELFAHPELAKQYLAEGYYLVDLRSDSIEKIQRDKKAALAELLLKQGKYRDFCAWIDRHETLLSLLAGPYNEEVYQYIYALDSNKEAILGRIERLKDPTQKHLAMTAAQYLEQRGRQEGMQQGRQEGEHSKALDIAKNMLSKGFASNLIQELAGVSAAELEQLEKNYTRNRRQ